MPRIPPHPEDPVRINCTIDTAGKSKIFTIQGELDVHNVKNLRSEVLESLEKGAWTYIIDMKSIDYLDSSGLGMLVFLKKEVLRNGGQLSIVNLQDSVLNVFKLTKLDDFFDLK